MALDSDLSRPGGLGQSSVDSAAMASFVVEARSPDRVGGSATFVAHHVEDDVTWGPLDSLDECMQWIAERLQRAEALADARLAPARKAGPPRGGDELLDGRRDGRLRISALGIRPVGDNGEHELSLVGSEPVALDADQPYVLVGRISVEGGATPATGQLRCRLHHLDSGTVREVVWGGDSVLRPGAGALEIVSPPLAIDAGVHQAEVYVEDRRHHARRAFRELSLIDAN